MRSARLFIGSVIVIGVMLSGVSSSYANFKTHTKGFEGKGSFTGMKLEAGGVTAECTTNLESESGNTWTIEKGKEGSETGPTLLLKVASWAKCVAEATGLKEAKEVKVTASECSFEAKEPEAEEKVPGTIASACSLKVSVGGVSVCQVSIEPAKELKAVHLGHTGSENESTTLEFALEGVTTVAKGTGCEKLGIKSSTTGHLSVLSEESGVAPELLVDEFELTRGGTGGLIPVGTERTVFLKFTGTGTEIPGALLVVTEELGLRASGTYFEVRANPVLTCRQMAYINNDTCEMKVRSLKITGNNEGACYLRFKITFNSRPPSEAYVFV